MFDLQMHSEVAALPRAVDAERTLERRLLPAVIFLVVPETVVNCVHFTALVTCEQLVGFLCA